MDSLDSPPLSLSGRCAIAGVGNTAYTRGTDQTTLELHLTAALRALDDAGLTPADVDGVMPNEMAGTLAEDFILNLGIRDLRYSTTPRTGGASFVTAIQSACLAIASGTCFVIPPAKVTAGS